MVLRWPMLTVAAGLHALLVLVPAWLLAGVLTDGEAPRLSPACGGLLLLASGWGVLEARWTSGAGDVGARGPGPALQGALMWWLMVCATSTLLIAPGSWFGALLVAAGIGLRLAAIVRLGPQFRTRLEGAPDQVLITTGLYAWVRHPSELGNVGIILGLAALAEIVPGVRLVAGAALMLVVHRVRLEDAALARGHGARFTAHARAVGAWLPLRACLSRMRGR
jgi:protein-S-isoprenylcysteine O-methyltransferase Ste14